VVAKKRNAMIAQNPENPITQYRPRKAFEIEGRGLSHDEIGRNVAAIATGPETAAARVIQAAERKTSLEDYLDVQALAATLRDQAAAVRGGSLGQAETILINQAAALQSLLARLVERSMGSDSVPGFEAKHADGLAGAGAVPGDAGDAGRDQEPAGRLRPAGERHHRPSAGQQQPSGVPVPTRARQRSAARQTFGGHRWPTAGHPSAVHARRN
jgi:hypothetical protein